MATTKKIIIMLTLATLSYASTSLALEFKIKGAIKASPENIAIQKLAYGGPVTILEPHLETNATYVGVPFNKLMDQYVGPDWKKFEEVLFTCIDGYQPSIPVEKFKAHEAWLVWAKKGDSKFGLINKLQNNEKIELGPFYLVWKNIGQTELLAEGATDFPYQIAKIDLISFKDKFPKLAPSKTDDSKIAQGFVVFRTYCMSCHAIDGDGGNKGPDLLKAEPMKRLTAGDWQKWLLNPTSVKPGTLMPPFAPKAKNREQKLEALMSYLTDRLGAPKK